jgi:metal-responsive CopG/Arc/MetJ family transcriptional regulator
MSVTKVAISLPEALLARADSEAAARGESRSAYIRTVLERALAAVEEERTLREARAVYEAIESDPELMLAHAGFADIARETIPPFRSNKPKPRGRSSGAEREPGQ